jgi:hypothetical protein
MYDPDLFELFNTIQRKLAAKAMTLTTRASPTSSACRRSRASSPCAPSTSATLEAPSSSTHATSADRRRHPLAPADPGRQTHVDGLDPLPDDPMRLWLFSRDCLELRTVCRKHNPHGG